MPNGFDFDFKKVYGQDFDKMSRNEKDAAILSQFYYLRLETKDASKISHCNETRLNKHSTYFKIISFCGGGIFLTLMGLLVRILYEITFG